MAPHPTGVGGAETINTTHFIGAVYGVERIMGRTANPVCPTLSAGKRIVVTGMCRRHQTVLRGVAGAFSQVQSAAAMRARFARCSTRHGTDSARTSLSSSP